MMDRDHIFSGLKVRLLADLGLFLEGTQGVIQLIGLQWGDVDFHGGFIEVRRAVVLGQEADTKNHKIRRVDLSPQLQAELQRLKELRQLESMSKGSSIAPWVFLSPGGLRWDDLYVLEVNLTVR
jgi:integrase